MKRICIDARMLGFSGISSYLTNLIQGLDSEKFAITLIVHPIHKRLLWLKKFSLVFTKAKIFSIREQLTLPFIIPRCNLSISPHFNVPIFPIRARNRIVVIHDVYHLRHLSHFSLLQRVYAWFMYRFAAYRSDKIITVSNFSKAEILDLLPVLSSKIDVIYLAVNSTFFQEKENQQVEKLKQKHLFSNPYFLFVGSSKEHKNLNGVIEAFRKFSETYQADLIVVGVRSDSMATMNSMGIHFLGSVEDAELRALYQHAFGLVFPSLYEGFGFPPLEAMSSGCPVITSNRASIPEVCQDAVFYVDPTDSEKICQAMIELVIDKEKRDFYIRKGLRLVQKYSWKDTLRRHEKLMEKFL